MVDGTGMCGGCRVMVGGKAQFACVDGPCFDAHEVDFEVAMRRNKAYVKEEKLALERVELHPVRSEGDALMPVKRADKTPMPVRDAQLRAHDFNEVNAGYTAAHAAFEAERCLRCQDPVCVDGCPVKFRSRDFIHAIAAGDMPERRQDPAQRQSAAFDLRARVSAGIAVRIANATWSSASIRWRSATWSATSPTGSARSRSAPNVERHAQGEDRRHRSGPVRARLRRRARAARLFGHRLRGAARAGRRAALRHPGVPAAQSRSSTGKSMS